MLPGGAIHHRRSATAESFSLPNGFPGFGRSREEVRYAPVHLWTRFPMRTDFRPAFKGLTGGDEERLDHERKVWKLSRRHSGAAAVRRDDRGNRLNLPRNDDLPGGSAYEDTTCQAGSPQAGVRSHASVTVIATMLTISCTWLEFWMTCTGLFIPIRIGPIASHSPMRISSL